MRYFIDTEFIEKPCTIELVSVGIVAEDGRQYYAENTEVDISEGDQWFQENVVPHLHKSPMYWRYLPMIRDELLEFIGDDKSPEFWGYYADYDWVVFCWIFGRMIDLPKGWPMYCRDIKQEADRLGGIKLPEQVGTEHNALADARWNRDAWEYLNELTI